MRNLSSEGDLREVEALKVALLQLPTKDGDLEANLELLKTMIKHVKAEAYLTPEMFLTGFEVKEGNFTINGVWSEVRELSEGKVLGVGGPLEEGGRLYNAYLVFDDKTLVSVRKKKMLFEPMKETEVFSVGDEPAVFEVRGFKFAVLICYEVRFPELFYPLFQRGLEAALIPAAWPESRIGIWEALVKARAFENLAYAIGVNRWGSGKYGPFGGHSLVATPSGKAFELGEGMGVLVVELSKGELERAKEFPSYKDRLELGRKLIYYRKG